MTFATVMPVMPVMHEEVHQRTGQEKKPGQRPENMGRVLGQQEKSRDNAKAQGDDPDWGPPPRLLVRSVIHGLQLSAQLGG